MVFRRKRISKASSRNVLHKYNESIIIKNPSIEKEHIITKIKRREKFYNLCLTSIFVCIFILILCLVGTSYRHFTSNIYESGSLSVQYEPVSDGISDIITLTDSNILEDGKAYDLDGYKFTITNTSNTKVKYQIAIRIDDDYIMLDGCKNNLFDISKIKYNINKGHIYTLDSTQNIDNQYILIEDVIPAKASKPYSLNVWVDKNMDYQDRHFHGVIEVNMK